MNENKKKFLIVISGKQLSGKDTLAKILLQKLDNFKRIGIGDAIKIEYGKNHNLTIDEIEKNKAVYRNDLIKLGDQGRAISDLFWLKKIIDSGDYLIIPDLRLKKELEYFKKFNSFFIRVNSDLKNRQQRGKIVNANDLTETDLDDISSWDFIVENNSDYNNLINQTDKLIKKLQETFLIQ